MSGIHLFISGLVQGVGYRAWVLHTASNKKLTGWVKNLADGRVEIMAEGKPDVLQEFIRLCRKGPAAAKIENVTIEEIKPTHDFTDFGVVY
jgi:acylphosphatase